MLRNVFKRRSSADDSFLWNQEEENQVGLNVPGRKGLED